MAARVFCDAAGRPSIPGLREIRRSGRALFHGAANEGGERERGENGRSASFQASELLFVSISFIRCNEQYSENKSLLVFETVPLHFTLLLERFQS